MLEKVQIWVFIHHNEPRLNEEMGASLLGINFADNFLLVVVICLLFCKYSLHMAVEKFATSVKNKNDSS